MKSVKALKLRGGTAPLLPPVYALATSQSIDPYISSYRPSYYKFSTSISDLFFVLTPLIRLFSPFHSSLILSGIFPFTFCCNERGFRFILILFSVSISLLFLFIFPYPPILYFSSSLFFHMFSSSKKNCPSFF